MKHLLTAVISLLIVHELQAQVDSIRNNKYRTVIDLFSTSSSVTGQLYRASDSSIVLRQKKKNVEITGSLNYSLLNIKVSDMDELSIYKKGKVGSSVLRGLLIGASIGALTGLITNHGEKGSFTTGQAVVILGVGFGFVGSLIGVGAGSSAEIWIPIKGDQKTYSKCHKVLIDYSIVK